MDYINKKSSSKQQRMTTLETEHNAWLDNGLELIKRKEDLGFEPEVSLEDFVALLPHDEKGKTDNFQFIALQKDIMTHMAQRRLKVSRESTLSP
jgi:hypothetical protein